MTKTYENKLEEQNEQLREQLEEAHSCISDLCDYAYNVSYVTLTVVTNDSSDPLVEVIRVEPQNLSLLLTEYLDSISDVVQNYIWKRVTRPHPHPHAEAYSCPSTYLSRKVRRKVKTLLQEICVRGGVRYSGDDTIIKYKGIGFKIEFSHQGHTNVEYRREKAKKLRNRLRNLGVANRKLYA